MFSNVYKLPSSALNILKLLSKVAMFIKVDFIYVSGFSLYTDFLLNRFYFIRLQVNNNSICFHLKVQFYFHCYY